jgi:MFS family permease
MNSIFYYTYLFNLLNILVVAYALPSSFNRSSQLGSPNRSRILSPEKPIISNINNFIGDRDSWFERWSSGNHKVSHWLHFMLHRQIRDLLLNAFVYGIVMTVPETYFFISLERDYHASRTFAGVATTVSVIACIPLFWYADYFIKHFGHYRVISLSQASCILRLLGYAFVQALHSYTYRRHTIKALTLLLLVQLLHGFNFALFIAAGVDLVSSLAPPDLTTSSLAVFNVVYMTLGPAVGSLLWGLLYDGNTLGVALVYFAAAFLCAMNALTFYCNQPIARMTNSNSYERLHEVLEFEDRSLLAS